MAAEVMIPSFSTLPHKTALASLGSRLIVTVNNGEPHGAERFATANDPKNLIRIMPA
jgi:hypothetical protein